MSEAETVAMFTKEFASNFNGTHMQNAGFADNRAYNTFPPLVSNCDETSIRWTISSCLYSSAGPDGFSMATIKKITYAICRPLLIIFQNSLFQGKFSAVWKLAHIAPIHKDKGNRCSPASCRLISLCSCFGKLLERIVKSQL